MVVDLIKLIISLKCININLFKCSREKKNINSLIDKITSLSI